MRKVIIANIHKGKGTKNSHLTYANLCDVKTGVLLISATLPYIVNAVNDPKRKLELVNAVDVLKEIFPFVLGVTEI